VSFACEFYLEQNACLSESLATTSQSQHKITSVLYLVFCKTVTPSYHFSVESVLEQIERKNGKLVEISMGCVGVSKEIVVNLEVS